jgi:hypothetical protein
LVFFNHNFLIPFSIIIVYLFFPEVHRVWVGSWLESRQLNWVKLVQLLLLLMMKVRTLDYRTVFNRKLRFVVLTVVRVLVVWGFYEISFVVGVGVTLDGDQTERSVGTLGIQGLRFWFYLLLRQGWLCFLFLHHRLFSYSLLPRWLSSPAYRPSFCSFSILLPLFKCYPPLEHSTDSLPIHLLDLRII